MCRAIRPAREVPMNRHRADLHDVAEPAWQRAVARNPIIRKLASMACIADAHEQMVKD